jgi:hypothetical protein
MRQRRPANGAQTSDRHRRGMSKELFMGVNQHHEGVELMLRLYDLRREPELRKARDWYLENFYPTSINEIEQKYPHRSDEET